MGYSATTFAPPITTSNPGVHYDETDDFNDSNMLNRGGGSGGGYHNRQPFNGGYYRNQPNIHNNQKPLISRSKTLQQQWPGSQQQYPLSTLNNNDDELRRSSLLQNDDDDATNPGNMPMRSPGLYSNFMNNRRNNQYRPDRMMDRNRGLISQPRGF